MQALSSSTMIINAMERFSDSFKTVAQNENIDFMRDQLAKYYTDKFDVQYKIMNNGESVSLNNLMNGLSDESVAVQYYYIQHNTFDLGEKHHLNSANDGSAYSQLHDIYHPPIRTFLEKFGFYDIFLVDSNTGNIIYSVYKEVDYTTSLLDGPYADTGIGEAFRSVRDSNQNDAVTLTDFASYTPSYEAPASFIASPIIKNGKNIGVLIFQMPVDRINAVMTNNEKWQDAGMGASGETYLVGENMTLRSQSRFLIEDKEAYLDALKNAGVDKNIIDAIDLKNTSIALQQINSLSATNAISGKSGYHIINDYRNVSVLSSYAPVNILGMKWGIIAEIDEAEAFFARSELKTSMLTFAVVICLVIAALAVAIAVMIAVGLIRPIVALGQVMADVERNNDLTLRSSNQSTDEIGAMASAFNSMLDKFNILITEVNSSSLQLAAASEEVSTVANNSSKSMAQQHLELEEITTAMNEMSTTVHDVARSASSAGGQRKVLTTRRTRGWSWLTRLQIPLIN
ncbi:MAG: methyl-accepting chemotaxis protein [Paraglaciecola sp.]|nr:methyl-accepting chemotaxis protein [Paraglaciecola sp.]